MCIDMIHTSTPIINPSHQTTNLWTTRNITLCIWARNIWTPIQISPSTTCKPSNIIYTYNIRRRIRIIYPRIIICIPKAPYQTTYVISTCSHIALWIRIIYIIICIQTVCKSNQATNIRSPSYITNCMWISNKPLMETPHQTPNTITSNNITDRRGITYCICIITTIIHIPYKPSNIRRPARNTNNRMRITHIRLIELTYHTPSPCISFNNSRNRGVNNLRARTKITCYPSNSNISSNIYIN